MIEKLQSDSRQAVNVMDSGKDQAQQSLEHATLAGDSLVKINSTVQGMLDMNRQIAAAAQSQDQTASQVNDNMSSIKALSEKTSVSANAIIYVFG